MSLTSDSDRPAPADGTHEPHEGAGATHRVSLGVFLRSRYWGRFLINAAIDAIILGLIDAVVPILNWPLILLALCFVAVTAVGSYAQVARTLALLLPAAAVQTVVLLDRPDDPQRIGIWTMSAALTVFAAHTLCTRKSRRQGRAPHDVMLELADGRQIPLVVEEVTCHTHPRAWHAVSAHGPEYLTDEWTLTHAGPRRHRVEPVVYHDEHGRAYVPDRRDLRDAL